MYRREEVAGFNAFPAFNPEPGKVHGGTQLR
jgi:hypothetical protein